MTTTHTPGPWQYTFEGGTVAFIVEADGTTVAKLSTTENSTAHSALPSNARLIAAAPELLAALQEVTRCLAWHAQEHPVGMDCVAVAKARAAIARATQEA